MQNIVILGSTGSIGCSTLDVIKLNLDKYKVFALTANSNLDKLLNQCIEFKPQYAVLLDAKKAKDLAQKLKELNNTTQVLSSVDDIVALVSSNDVDIVMSAIVGSAGLVPTYAAIKAHKKVLLANKESLVTAGEFLINTLKSSENKAILIPVDSEHSAIFQSLPEFIQNNACLEDNKSSINKIILTASGGPFRTYTLDDLDIVTPESALKHPNWSMGRKISVDSSTLMNKGLEVIEAHWLFGGVKIDVVVHPQSVIHSMVEYIDGSIIAQLGVPDMKTPIAYALSYPERIKSGSQFLDFKEYSNLTFEEVDYTRFPCLKLAFIALESGGAMPAVLNAANEIAVDAFLNNKISYKDIYKYVNKALEHFSGAKYSSIEAVIEVDTNVRSYLTELI